MDDYKECENYPLLSSLDQKYYEIEENQNLQTNQNHIKFDEDYDSESLLSLCTLFISENNEENMLKQYETFSKITNIIKQSTGKVDIECLQNADFGNAFCSLLHFLFEEGTNFIPFIQLLNDICLNNSDFIECLSSTDLSSMLFEIFCNSDDQIQNIIIVLIKVWLILFIIGICWNRIMLNFLIYFQMKEFLWQVDINLKKVFHIVKVIIKKI